MDIHTGVAELTTERTVEIHADWTTLGGNTTVAGMKGFHLHRSSFKGRCSKNNLEKKSWRFQGLVTLVKGQLCHVMPELMASSYLK